MTNYNSYGINKIGSRYKKIKYIVYKKSEYVIIATFYLHLLRQIVILLLELFGLHQLKHFI